MYGDLSLNEERLQASFSWSWCFLGLCLQILIGCQMTGLSGILKASCKDGWNLKGWRASELAGNDIGPVSQSIPIAPPRMHRRIFTPAQCSLWVTNNANTILLCFSAQKFWEVLSPEAYVFLTPIQGIPLSKPIPLPCHGIWLILLKPYPLEFPAWINQGLDVCLSLLCLLKQQSLQYSSLPLTTQCSLNMMLTQPQSPAPTRTLSRVQAWDPSPSLSNSKIILLLTGER